MTERRRCDNCVHGSSTLTVGAVQCRRFPPQGVMGANGILWLHPVMQENDVCGEHRSNLEQRGMWP